MVLVASVLVAFFTTLWPHFPNPLDADGWGLRLHRSTLCDPYLVGETVERVQFDILLINFSKETRECNPLVVAKDVGDLRISITKPDGKPLGNLAGQFQEKDPFTQPIKLRASEFTSTTFRFGQFGYASLRQVGRYRSDVVLKINGNTITAPPIQFNVVDIAKDMVLATYALPLEGQAALQRPEDQWKPVIQQVKVGNRTFLIYRLFLGSKDGNAVYATSRLVELSAQCEMKVEGAYGAGKPLTIVYKETNSPKGVNKLTINSIDGVPWTVDDERLFQLRNKPQSVRP